MTDVGSDTVAAVSSDHDAKAPNQLSSNLGDIPMVTQDTIRGLETRQSPQEQVLV